MAALKEKNKELQEAIATRDGLRQELAELPSLKRRTTQELAAVVTKDERRRLKGILDDAAINEIVLPLKVQEAEFAVEELRSASLVAEASELEERARPLSEEGYEARSKREHWEAVEHQKLSEADGMSQRAFRLRRQAADIGHQLSAKRQRAQQEEQWEEVPGPATRGREAVFDTVR